MRESCIVITFYLKDLKVLQESVCKSHIDYSSSVKLGLLFGKPSETKPCDRKWKTTVLKCGGNVVRDDVIIGNWQGIGDAASFPTKCIKWIGVWT